MGTGSFVVNIKPPFKHFSQSILVKTIYLVTNSTEVYQVKSIG